MLMAVLKCWLGASCRELSRMANINRRFDREANEEGGPLTAFGLEAQCAPMFLDDDTMRDCQSLASPLADFLCRKEWVENLIACGYGNAGAAIANRDLHHLAIEPRTHGQLAQTAAVFDDIGYRMRCIYQQVEDHLIDLAQIARYRRQLTELRAQLGDVLVFVIRNDEGAANRLIQVGQRRSCLVRMREFFHRAHNR